MPKKVLITGCAGFIGFHTVQSLLANYDYDVVGIDNINDYYPMTLKFERLKELGIQPEFIRYNQRTESSLYNNFQFMRIDITDEKSVTSLFEKNNFNYVIHLAAQAGVRYSIDNPNAYIKSNILGFNTILESCRNFKIDHLVYASSSSVYGLNTQQPFSIKHKTDEPISLYASTKKSNELMAHTYSHLFKIPTTGLRFFTVYGPWGRPDMAPMLFAKAILKGEPIKVFNNGSLERDFTYVTDIVRGVCKAKKAIPKPNEKGVPYQLFNIGSSNPVNIMEFIDILSEELGVKSKKEFLPMQEGDMLKTYADISEFSAETGYKPTVSIREGVREFASWYKSFYLKNS